MKVAARMHAESPELVEKIMEVGKTTFVSIPNDYDVEKVKKYEHAIYLYCILKYPTWLEEVTMPDFKSSIFAGISDHSLE